MATTLRLAMILSAAVAVVAAFPGDARACSCVETTAEGSYRAATAVFEGRWTAGDSEHATFELVRIWKGLDDNPDSVEVTLGEYFAACTGFPESDIVAEPGVAHVVYADTLDGALILGACGRYFPSDRAAAEFAHLDAAATARTPGSPVAAAAPTEPPAIVPPPSAPPSAGRGCRIGAPPTACVVLCLTLVALRRPRRRAIVVRSGGAAR